MKEVLDLAKMIEEAEGLNLWRYSWVVPANKSNTKKKKYNFEFPAMTSDEIGSEQVERGKLTIPGRGWKTMEEIPKGFKEKNKELGVSYPALSIYLKFVPDLYVIDFDDMSRCILKEDHVEPDSSVENDEGKKWNPFFDYCMKSDTLYTKTAKGYHFYFYLPGCPHIESPNKIQKWQDYGDVDILGRNVPGANNVVEACHHQVYNMDEGIESIKNVPFEEISPFIDVDLMTTKKGSGDIQTHKEKNENKAICPDGYNLDLGKFKSYLARLRTSDHPTQMDLKSRYHYDDWVKIGMICKNNFGAEDGFDVWRSWTMDDPNIETDEVHKGRALHGEMWKKWETFKLVPGQEPATWRSLRAFANKDDPTINPYEEIYQSGGISSMVEYMNGFTMFNVETCEIIYENPNETKAYDGKPKTYKAEKAKLVFSKYSFMVENPHTGKEQFKNPFDIWMTNTARRDVNAIVFDPSPNAPEDVYNLFKGFNIPASMVADMSLEEAMDECGCLINHIQHIWCHGDEESFNYVMNWFAFVVQKPEQKIKVLICVKSKEGAGKGIVFSFLREILGDRLYAQVNSIDSLTGKFNPILEGRLLINGDEIVWGGDMQKGNKMKNIISEPEMWIEKKNRDTYCVKSTTAFCFASNMNRCVSAQEGDRRTFATELDNKWAGRQTTQEHIDYFNNISGTKNHTIARSKALAFAKILFSRDISDFVPSNAPITEMLTDNMERNMPPLHKFWKNLLTTGRFTIGEQFKKMTRRDYVNEHGEKKFDLIPYAEEQLLWGNVGDEYGNGIKETKMKYMKTDEPIIAFAYAYKGSLLWKNWQKVLKHIKEVKYYEFADDDDLEKIPIPEAMVDISKKLCGNNPQSRPSLSEDFRYYKAQKKKNSNHIGLYDVGDLGRPDIGVDPMALIGLRQEHIQPKGVEPRMIRDTNVGEDCPEKYPTWHYDTSGLGWHFEDLDQPNMFDEITLMGRSDSMDEEKKDCHLENWKLFPHHYVQKCDFTFDIESTTTVFREGEDDEWSNENWEIDGISMDEENQSLLCSYLDHHLDELLPATKDEWFSNVVSRNWYDDSGNQLYFHKKREKVIKWLYDKDWVFNRYKESSGLGYGHNTPDSGEFWKGIIEMLGGLEKDGKGGLFKNVFYEKNHHRIAYFKFVSLSKARVALETFFGRKIKWEDEDDEGNVDDEDNVVQEWY